MFKKFIEDISKEETTVIEEIDKFREMIHHTSTAALALMDLGILPDDKMTKEKALLSHGISRAIEDILSGMSATDAMNKMVKGVEGSHEKKE